MIPFGGDRWSERMHFLNRQTAVPIGAALFAGSSARGHNPVN
jgi:hypothetical protein